MKVRKISRNDSDLIKILPQITLLLFVIVLILLASFPSIFKGTIADIKIKGQELASSTGVSLGSFGNSRYIYNTKYSSHLLSENIVPIPDSNLAHELKYEDLRSIALEKYLREKRNSPTADYAYLYIYYADLYNVPWILMPAIGEAETHSCTHKAEGVKVAPSSKQKNCWGIGGNPKNRVVYKTWEQSIESAVRLISTSYGQGTISMTAIQRKYCGSGCVGDVWSRRVIYYVNKINEFSSSIGAPVDNNVTL